MVPNNIMISDSYNDIMSRRKSRETLDIGSGEETKTGIKQLCGTNVISKDKLKAIQEKTLGQLSEYLAYTYGPMGSYTEIISGSDQDSVSARYSKDGLTVLKHIYFNMPIEATIRSEIESICRYVEVEVGDGTTSAVILSNLIFKEILRLEKIFNVLPRDIVKAFNKVVEFCQNYILNSAKHECTIKDIKKICMISTNGNEEVSNNIQSIYDKFGLDADIEVDISTDENSMIKEYDGITIEEGFCDPAFINADNNIAEVHNAKVYYFQDPADDMNMISIFEKILYDNILHPLAQSDDPVPTVIMVPKLSRDSSAILDTLVKQLKKYDAAGMKAQKPQLIIITNYIGADEGVANDIAYLCGCKDIKKYINAEHEKHDQEAGLAATPENVHEFSGGCELVIANARRTKFINPEAVTEDPKTYDALIDFLETELKRCKDEGEDDLETGRIKKRLRRLRTNNVEYFIGGIDISDRDALRDLVIDAVKNCKSAAENGICYAANFEGLVASLHAVEYFSDNRISLEYQLAESLVYAYSEAIKILYRTVIPEETLVDKLIIDMLEYGAPANITDIKYHLTDRAFSWSHENGQSVHDNNSVICSVMVDIKVLDAISRIISIMATSNQCLLQTTDLNRY